jgi:hypothetical protein
MNGQNAHRHTGGGQWDADRHNHIAPAGTVAQTPRTVQTPEARAAYERMQARIIGQQYGLDGNDAENINQKLGAK